MKIFLGYYSALEYRRSLDASSIRYATKAIPQPGSAPNACALKRSGVLELSAFGRPMHVVVTDSASRRALKDVRCHIWNGPVGAKSYERIDKDIYVSTPEACFMQMSGVLSLVELVKVGFEFCGGYALDATEGSGFRKQDPQTTVGALRRYASKMQGRYGATKVEKALDFVADGSASPRETVLAMLLCLPRSMGGYGLMLPKMNYRVDTSIASGGGTHRLCDLYWPKVKTAVEYDSDLYHTGKERIAKDADRRTTLSLSNIDVITMTSGQILDARAFDRTAQLLSRRMKKRTKTTMVRYMSRRYELRKQLLTSQIFSVSES